MKTGFLQVNLMLAWLWILLGFLSGLALGVFFRRENWLGGYTSLKRRLYRLGHVSFFGLGVLNLMFCLTVADGAPPGPALQVVSVAFITGAVTMPLCCGVTAHYPKAHPIFAVPVVSLILGAALLLRALTSP